MQIFKRPLLFIAASLMLVVGCKKDEFTPVQKERTYLHFLNTYGGARAIDIYLESFETNGLFAADIDFMAGWPNGGYASLLTNAIVDSIAGEGETLIRAVNRGSGKEVVPYEPFWLSPDVQSTLALIDSFGKAKFVKTIDIFEVPNTDTASNIRFMNLNYATVSVSLQTGDLTFSIDRLNFLNYSSFNQIKPGEYDFLFVNDQSGTVLDRIDNVEIEPRKTYNFFLARSRSGAPRGEFETIQ